MADGITNHKLKQIINRLPCLKARFLGVFPRDKLPNLPRQLPACFIINSDSANLPGQHWTAIYISHNRIADYFDSYGFLPPTQVQRWLNLNSRFWFYNSHCMQKPLSAVCGFYCIYFLINRFSGVSLQHIITSLVSIADIDEYVKNYVLTF